MCRLSRCATNRPCAVAGGGAAGCMVAASSGDARPRWCRVNEWGGRNDGWRARAHVGKAGPAERSRVVGLAARGADPPLPALCRSPAALAAAGIPDPPPPPDPLPLFFEECAEFGITPVQYGLLTILSTSRGRPGDARQCARHRPHQRRRCAPPPGAGRADPPPAERPDDRRMVLARLTPRGRGYGRAHAPLHGLGAATAPARCWARGGARRVSRHADAAAGGE